MKKADPGTMAEVNRLAKVLFRRLQTKGIRQLTIQSGDELFVFSGNPGRKSKRLVYLLVLFAIAFSLYLLMERPFFMKSSADAAASLDMPRDRSGLTPLHLGVIAGDGAQIRLWLDRHADIDAADDYGWTPLHWAVFLRNKSICQFLIENGARVDIGSTLSWYRYSTGVSPLEMADMNQQPDIIKILKIRGGR